MKETFDVIITVFLGVANLLLLGFLIYGIWLGHDVVHFDWCDRRGKK